jgi:type IV secretory pathway TraG/TraD family ATPase VirD4
VGKTSGVVIPAILRWFGPVVVTSVKRDVVDATRDWRTQFGPLEIVEPAEPDGHTWDPLETVTDLRTGLAVARDLVLRGTDRSSSESEFWNALAVKTLGAMLVTTARHGGDVFDVVRLVESRRFADVAAEAADDDARRILEATAAMESRTLDAVGATIDAMLVPWQIRQPTTSVRSVLENHGTLYLCAPRTDHRHHEGLFRGLLRTVFDEQQRMAHEGRAPRLLVVLDEAASIAPVDDLDQVAATVSGLNVTLLSVFQDFAQITARWGERAATVVNNHTTRVVLGGLVDPAVAHFLPAVLRTPAERRPPPLEELRQLPRGTARVVSGNVPTFTTHFSPWWRSRELRVRGVRA